MKMPTLSQYVHDVGNIYKHAHNDAVPEVEITDAPEDCDFTRFAMAHGNDQYRLFCMKAHTRDTVYVFSYNAESCAYVYGHEVEHAEMCLTNIPDDLDASTFDALCDGTWRLYFKRLGNPCGATQLYQFVPDGDAFVCGGGQAIPAIEVIDFPKSDRARWFMYHDGNAYVYSTFAPGSNRIFYSGGFNGSAYQLGCECLAELLVEGGDEQVRYNPASMLFDGSTYRLYFINE